MTEILSLNTMGDLTLNELLNKMTEIHSSSIKYIFMDDKDKATAAVVVLKGTDTSRYIDALDTQETLIRAESAVSSNTDHTSEKWLYSKHDNMDHPDCNDYVIRNQAGALIAQTFELVGRHRTSVDPQANARRIVACVNACAGVGTETLENSPDLASAFISAKEVRLNIENQALTHGLKDILSRFKSCISGGNGQIDGDLEAIKFAEVALGSAVAA